MLKPQAIIFDLDGVIIDSEALHNQAVALALAQYGVTLPTAIYDEFMGIPDTVFMAHVSQQYLASAVTVDELMAAKQRVFLQTAGQTIAVPGALAFLARVRPQVQGIGLATSSLRVNQQLAFDQFALHPYFDAVVTADDVQHTKPDPEPYLRAVAALGLPAAACLVIEDSVNGILAAKGAGCQVVGLTTSYPAATLHAAGADQVCANYGEIAQWLGLE